MPHFPDAHTNIKTRAQVDAKRLELLNQVRQVLAEADFPIMYDDDDPFGIALDPGKDFDGFNGELIVNVHPSLDITADFPDAPRSMVVGEVNG